jgi:hypothetical protein
MAMVSEVSRALKVYEALPPAGKRLFREELGLVRPQQATRRRARKAKTVQVDAEPGWTKPARVTRKRSDTTITINTDQPAI